MTLQTTQTLACRKKGLRFFYLKEQEQLPAESLSHLNPPDPGSSTPAASRQLIQILHIKFIPAVGCSRVTAECFPDPCPQVRCRCLPSSLSQHRNNFLLFSPRCATKSERCCPQDDCSFSPLSLRPAQSPTAHAPRGGGGDCHWGKNDPDMLNMCAGYAFTRYSMSWACCCVCLAEWETSWLTGWAAIISVWNVTGKQVLFFTTPHNFMAQVDLGEVSWIWRGGFGQRVFWSNTLWRTTLRTWRAGYYVN